MLNSPSSLPVANQSSVAIGIAGSCVTGDTAQKHVALIYRDDGQMPKLLHLGWHRCLRHEPWDGNYHWIEMSALDIEVQETFADWAVIVANAEKESRIPYSIVFSPGKNFDLNGQYIDRKDGSGLTCATFLLALFSDFKLPLVQTDTWPHSRPGDFRWLRKILKSLRGYFEKYMPSELHHFLEQFRRRHALKRYRPEEVFACAGLYSGTPLSFNTVDPIARQLLAKIPS